MTQDRCQSLINQANGRLKTARMGVTIRRRGQRLYLRATLPPKPAAQHKAPHPQEIALKIYANAAGISEAEKQAKALSVAIAGKTFDWVDWADVAVEAQKTIGQWRERFFEEFRKERKLKESTWKSSYRNPLRRLDGDRALTMEELRSFILNNSKPNTQSRRRLCLAYRRFAHFAGQHLEVQDIIGSYGAQEVDPRTLPSDAEIIAAWESIPDPHWRQSFARQAIYGLRNHGCYRAMILPDHYAQVTEKRDKSPRIVPPLYPEWVERLELGSVALPDHDPERTNEWFGAWHCRRLRREFKVPFKPYTLRHCYARRAYEFGFSVDDASRAMGHSPDVHLKTYRRWIGDEVWKRTYQALVASPNRPTAPH